MSKAPKSSGKPLDISARSMPSLKRSKRNREALEWWESLSLESRNWAHYLTEHWDLYHTKRGGEKCFSITFIHRLFLEGKVSTEVGHYPPANRCVGYLQNLVIDAGPMNSPLWESASLHCKMTIREWAVAVLNVAAHQVLNKKCSFLTQ